MDDSGNGGYTLKTIIFCWGGKQIFKRTHISIPKWPKFHVARVDIATVCPKNRSGNSANQDLLWGHYIG